MIGLQALSVALAVGTVPPDPVLFRLPNLPPVQQELYAAAPFATVATLPWKAASPGAAFAVGTGFSACIDLRDFAFDPGFRGMAMIDFFLDRLGVSPGAVPPEAKRNTWLAGGVTPAPHAPGHVLLCPRASMPLRDMPAAIEAAIIGWLAQHTGRPVRLQHKVATLRALCDQVAGAAMVVSTDTAMVHLADAFDVPCLAFFPTHDPAWRVRDYPRCRAVGLHAAGLEPALEFARGPADLAAAHAAWFPRGPDLTWLQDALRDALEMAERSA